MRILTLLLLSTLSYCFISTHAYRDGAREESCYNHTIVHDNAFVRECAVGCRYFLIVKEVVNETTLELGNETTSYECGKIYGIEVANDLNAPEGYLVQARDGTEDSSEIIGTFLDPTVVEERNPTIPRNFEILQCRSSMSSTGGLLDNSATHPNTVNMAGVLQLYWQAPNCSNSDLPNVTLWFTIVQQLTVVYNPSKSTVLTYIPPPPPPTTTSAPTTTTESPPTMLPPTTRPDQGSNTTTMPPKNDTSGALSMGAIIGIAVGGGGGLIAAVVIIIVIVIAVVCGCGGCKGKDAPEKEIGHEFTSPMFGKEGNNYQDVLPTVDASASTFGKT